MAYEVFKRTAARVDTPTVSIVPNGRIAINAAVVRLFKQARISFVQLLWDDKNRRMALKATQKNDRNAYAVSFSEGRSGSLRAKSFLAHIRWKARNRERLSAIWNEKELMLEVTLPSEYL
jgi:hypothetical protein